MSQNSDGMLPKERVLCAHYSIVFFVPLPGLHDYPQRNLLRGAIMLMAVGACNNVEKLRCVVFDPCENQLRKLRQKVR